jgi:hypothetical protein
VEDRDTEVVRTYGQYCPHCPGRGDLRRALNAADHCIGCSRLPHELRNSSERSAVRSGEWQERNAKIAEVLRTLGVRVVAGPDLDFLNDRSLIKRLVSAMGGEWEPLRADYDTATEQFRQPRSTATGADVLNAVNGVLSAHLSGPYDAELQRKVRAQLRTADSPWNALKQHGLSAFQSGRARSAAERLLASLSALGVRPVPVGELERFAPTIEVAKGPRWLAAA